MPAEFVAFRKACRDAQPAWEVARCMTSVRDVGTAIAEIVRNIGCHILRVNGYVRKTVTRSLLLACPNVLNAAEEAPWASVRRVELQMWVPDQSHVLEMFPPTATAADISTFMFGRPDWGLFVSLWGCTWHPVPGMLKKAGLVPDNASAEVAQELLATVDRMAKAGAATTPVDVMHKWLVDTRPTQPADDAHAKPLDKADT